MTIANGQTILAADILAIQTTANAASATATTNAGLLINSGTIAGSTISLGQVGGGTIALTGTLPAASTWNGGTVSALGANLTLSAGTLAATGGGSAIWNAGTVTTVGSNITVSAGTIAATVPVASVASRTGAVVLTHADMADFNTSAAAAAPVQTVAGRAGAVVVTSSDLADFATAVATNAPIRAVDTSLVLNSGTVGLATLAAGKLHGNSGTVAAQPGAIAIGSNLTLSALGTLSATVPVTAVDTSLVLNSGTAGLANLAATSVLGNGGTASAQPSGLVLNSANFVVASGTISTSGTLAVVNVTSNAGYQINGVSILNIDGSGSQSTYLGINAGATSSGSTGLGCTFLGNGAGQAMHSSASENTFVGAIAGQMLTTGNFDTALGEHAMGYEQVASSSTAIGNDSMRSWHSAAGQSTAVGKSSMEYGGADNTTVVGMSAIQGNSSNIQVTGTAGSGGTDTVSLVFTGTFTGSPVTVGPVTLTASQTAASVATALAAAINAKTALTAGSGPLGSGGIGTGGSLATVIDTSNILMNFDGTATTGVACAIAPSVTTAGTTAVTVTGGLVGQGNVAIGQNAMRGNYMTSATYNVSLSSNTLQFLTTGSHNFAACLSAGQAITTGSSNILIGEAAGSVLTTASGSIALGLNSLSNAVTGGNNVAVGNSAMRFYNGTFGGANQASVAVGSSALSGTTGSSYLQSVAVGGNAGAVVTTAARLTLLGSNTGAVITTGGFNTIVGANVGSATLVSGTGNIYIGPGATTATIDAASAGESNTLRIGNNAVNTIVATNINTATPTIILSGLVGKTPSTGITAFAGGGQTSATLLTNSHNLVATVATTGDSIKLPVTTTVGLQITLTNNGANSLQLFGSGTDTINSVATATGVAVAAGKTGIFTSYASGAWFGGTLT